MSPLILILVLAANVSTATTSPLTAAASKLSYELGAQLFVRSRATYGDKASLWDVSHALTRARLLASFEYDELLRLTLEPDFAGAVCASTGAVCDDAELSDVFVELSPLKELSLRVGQAKSPYGIVETTSEWELPVLHRGLVSKLVTGRLGFGGRHLGARARLKLMSFETKPSVELGVYNDPSVGDESLDYAGRFGLKLFKGARLELSGYARANGLGFDKHGLAAALGASYDRGGLFVLAEVGALSARRLSISISSSRGSTAMSVRAIGSYAIPLWAKAELEPYVAIDGFEPDVSTKSDLGGSVRGGLGLFWSRVARASLEVERRGGQSSFVAPNETLVTLLVGASLEAEEQK